MFYRLNRGTMDDFIIHLTGKKPKKNAKPCPSYTNDVFFVTLQYGNAMNEERAFKDYGADTTRKFDIPVTSVAVEMIAEILVRETKHWPNKDRLPHYDELEYAFFGNAPCNGGIHRMFNDNRRTYYVAPTDTNTFGFRDSGYLRRLFSEVKVDIDKYYENQKITISNTVSMDTVYEALWSLALRSLEKEWPIITAPRVPISKCCYCGEIIWSTSIGFLHFAGDIEMGFGYGSRRDCTVAKALIHDHCSIDWQKSWKGHVGSWALSHDQYNEKGQFTLKSAKYKQEYQKIEKTYE